ncbi:MAG: SGNH/GDSL hydrolase family protein [Bryobacteraceae bacterium]|nr:SGNH/GDSL hydrolase family protein [Bryobacteraceae bacterium]MDW8378239.1 SGNH/GDSL hydrolase family protein [Bryobacterales bacterium]
MIAAILPWLVLLGGPPASGSDNGRTRQQLEQELDAYRRVLMDWAGLTRYGSENTEIRLRPGVDRVVFLGDEITEHWGSGKTPFFPGKPYFNRGITRQTTAQMLVRFRQDVISLKPKVVIIQAGTNDLASVMGPSTLGTMADHFASMVDLARFHGIRPVIASILPVCDCGRKLTDRRPPGKIIGLNQWLKEFAAENQLVYLDYYSVLVDGRSFRRDLTVDGLIPNDAGYALMAPLAEEAIEKALRR